MEVIQNLKKRGQIHFQPPSPALLNKIMEKFGVGTKSSIDSKTKEHERKDMTPKAKNQQPVRSPSDTKMNEKGGGFSNPHFLNQLEGEEIIRIDLSTGKPLMILQSSDPSIQTIPDEPSKVEAQIDDQVTTRPNTSHHKKLVVEGKVIEPLRVVGKSTATFPSASG